MIPIIWGQKEGYIYLQLRDFKSGVRKNEQMAAVTETLEREDLLALAALLTGALAAGAPVASDAKKYKHSTHHISTVQSGTYAGSGMSAAQPRTYGTSGKPVGTVTAPSVGSYYWPSVGVTNAVPTWNNSGPSGRR